MNERKTVLTLTIGLFVLIFLKNSPLLAQPDTSTQWLENVAFISLDRGNPTGIVSLDYNIIAVSYYSYGIVLYDISTPEAPLETAAIQLRTWLPGGGHPTRLAKFENTLYVATAEGGLGIMDISNPTTPVWIGSVENVPCNTKLEIIDHYLIVSAEQNDCSGDYYGDWSVVFTHNILNIDSPRTPHLVYTHTASESYYSEHLYNSRQYAVINNRFYTVNQFHPIEMSQITYHSLINQDDTGFVTLDTGRLLLPPDVEFTRFASLIGAHGSELLIQTKTEFGEYPDSIYHYDLSDPNLPVLCEAHEVFAQYYGSINHWDLMIDQGFFLGYQTVGLYHPDNGQFEEFGSFPRGGDYQIALQENLLIMAAGEQGLLVWELRTSSNPQLLATIGLQEARETSDFIKLAPRTYAVVWDDCTITCLKMDEDFQITARRDYTYENDGWMSNLKLYADGTTLFLKSWYYLVCFEIGDDLTLHYQYSVYIDDLPLENPHKFLEIHSLVGNSPLVSIEFFVDYQYQHVIRVFLLSVDHTAGSVNVTEPPNLAGTINSISSERIDTYDDDEALLRVYTLENPFSPTLAAEYECQYPVREGVFQTNDGFMSLVFRGDESCSADLIQYRFRRNQVVKSGLHLEDSGTGRYVSDISANYSPPFFCFYNPNRNEVWLSEDQPNTESYTTVSYAIQTTSFPVTGLLDENAYLLLTGSDIMVFTDEIFETRGVTNTSTQPTKPTLSDPWPNPSNSTITLSIALPSLGYASLEVYNLLGKQVANLPLGQLNPGQCKKVFNATALPSGVYFLRAKVNNQVSAPVKAVLLK